MTLTMPFYSYSYQIVSGIEYCHYHKIVHRDLKPEVSSFALIVHVSLICPPLFFFSLLLSPLLLFSTLFLSSSLLLLFLPHFTRNTCIRLGVELHFITCVHFTYDQHIYPLLFMRIDVSVVYMTSSTLITFKDMREMHFIPYVHEKQSRVEWSSQLA